MCKHDCTLNGDVSGTIGIVSGNVTLDGAGHSFSLAAPNGGNHWSDWTAPDANSDGFVDSAYVFSGGQDSRPWVSASGWNSAKPDLRLFKTGTFWVTLENYNARILTVYFQVRNLGVNATSVEITGSTAPWGSSGTAMPISLGAIANGSSSATFPIEYPDVPQEVNNFLASVFGRADGCCGVGFTYP